MLEPNQKLIDRIHLVAANNGEQVSVAIPTAKRLAIFFLQHSIKELVNMDERMWSQILLERRVDKVDPHEETMWHQVIKGRVDTLRNLLKDLEDGK